MPEDAPKRTPKYENPFLEVIEAGFNFAHLGEGKYRIHGTDNRGRRLSHYEDPFDSARDLGFTVERLGPDEYEISGKDRFQRTITHYFDPCPHIHTSGFDVQLLGPGQYVVAGSNMEGKSPSAYMEDFENLRIAGFDVQALGPEEYKISAPDKQRQALIDMLFRPFFTWDLLAQSNPLPQHVLETLRYHVDNKIWIRPEHVEEIINKSSFTPEQFSLAYQCMEEAVKKIDAEDGEKAMPVRQAIKQSYENVGSYIKKKIDEENPVPRESLRRGNGRNGYKHTPLPGHPTKRLRKDGDRSNGSSNG